MESDRPHRTATPHDVRTAELRNQFVRIDREVARLAAAIASGGDLPALVAAIQDRERRRTCLRAEVTTLERQATQHDVGDDARALDVMRPALTDWQGMLRQEPPAARRALRPSSPASSCSHPAMRSTRSKDRERSRRSSLACVQRGVVTPNGINPCSSLEGAAAYIYFPNT